MKKLPFYVSIVSLSAFLTAGLCTAAEHPGTAVEHPGETVKPGKTITAKFVKKSIEEHVKARSKTTGGVFVVHDDKLNRDWKLKLDKVHDPVRMFVKEGKTIYFACSDFKAVDGKDILDIDFWMVPKGDGLEVIDTRIHKLNGEPRYGYEGVEIKDLK
ncbi:MAG: hypothetical protein FD174_3892 [Geobacteraceae bacterium]|nr:MAG: hypothetical protein FD174_3892 [Geobacteraceae bacterium]